MDRRTFVTTAGAAVASVGIAGCTGMDGGDGNGGGNQSTGSPGAGQGGGDGEWDWEEIEAEIGQTPNNINLKQSRLVETQQGAAVIGTIQNSGNKPYSVLEVEVTLKDGDTIIGEWADTSEKEIDNLAPGETWRFVATFNNENVYQATGYTIGVEGDLEQSEGDGTGNSSS